jgi:hypothetical protein
MTTTTTELVTTGKEAKDNAAKLVSSLKSAYGLAKRAAQEQLEQRPYVTLGVAASAGFVVAGGLSSSITRGLVSSGTRLAALKLFDLIVESKEEK